MAIARGIGPSERVAIYKVPDGEMAAGSTLGGPKVCIVIKPTGAIEKVYSIDAGKALLGTLVLHHWDELTGMHLSPHPGTFTIYPEHQEHDFALSNDVHVHENIFVLNGGPQHGDQVDPPGVYYTVQLRNDADEERRIATYAFCELRGETDSDIVATYEKGLGALIAWNDSHPELARVFGCSERPDSFETTLDHGKAVSEDYPGRLADSTEAPGNYPLGVLHHSHTLKPGQSVQFYYLLSFSGEGRRGAIQTYRACPGADEALACTTRHYQALLGKAVVLTPNPEVNRGVLWAKANMLRVEMKAPSGWCLTNDPTRSSKAVGRDTAWFAYGSDYLTPEFARDSLLAFVRRQEPSGMIVESYDMRTGKSQDLGLNINDDTPLLILALLHHYDVTGDEEFLREVYPAAARAARYIHSQRNDQGLVWCTATATGEQGIIGWRNIIEGHRISGAVTEVNSECFAALRATSRMATVLGKHDESAEFAQHADALKEAINTHLYNPANGLYYLNIDVDGYPRSDVTSDLVFPVLFGVADDATAARIISRLSSDDFWTEAGIRTVPRDAPSYSPDRGYGLLGGVWVCMSFWYAFGAARFTPEFMDHALASSFQNYSRDPRKNNTVPGQFSEWLHGETLVNEGMMLSPWYPPRYLWAAIEGAGGFDPSGPHVEPRPAPSWKWLGVQSLPYRRRSLTWFAVRMPDVQVYANFHSHDAAGPYVVYEEDISGQVDVSGDAACAVGLRQGGDLIFFVGSTEEHTVTVALRLDVELAGSYRRRVFDSLVGHWVEDDHLVPAEKLREGLTLQIERRGFYLLSLQRSV
jgi:Bacterial alpha-L-rhamnosidase 6 hairpin glycosidase domain